MSKLKELKDEIREEIDKFCMVNTSVSETISYCEPFFSLYDCENLDEVNEYVEAYIDHIENAISQLEKFNKILEKIGVDD